MAKVRRKATAMSQAQEAARQEDPSQERVDISRSEVVLHLPVRAGDEVIEESRKDLVRVVCAKEAAAEHYLEASKSMKLKIRTLERDISKAAHSGHGGDGGKIAATMDTLRGAQDDLVAVSRQYNAQIAELDGRAKRLASIIQSGVEYLGVLCVVEKNYMTKQVMTIRKGTMEIVEQRAMTIDEMQMDMAEAV